MGKFKTTEFELAGSNCTLVNMNSPHSVVVKIVQKMSSVHSWNVHNGYLHATFLSGPVEKGRFKVLRSKMSLVENAPNFACRFV